MGVDIGGTHVRIGFVRATTSTAQRLPKTNDLIAFETFSLHSLPGRYLDIQNIVREIARRILRRVDRLEKKGWEVIRAVGVSAPGAYLTNGHVYPGTAPNLKGLQRVQLFKVFLRHLGGEWRVSPSHVNNDGVLQGLVIARAWVKHRRMKSGKIVVFVPGTGFGAGVYEVKGGKVWPVRGPQQLFDVVVRRGFMAEELITGQALGMYGKNMFHRPLTGAQMSHMALGSRRSRQGELARQIFRQVGRDFAALIMSLNSGHYAKRRVPYHPDTRGAKVFLVGGNWMLQGAGRRIALREAFHTLQRSGKRLKVIPCDKIAGLKGLSQELGIWGATLLVNGKSRF